MHRSVGGSLTTTLSELQICGPASLAIGFAKWNAPSLATRNPGGRTPRLMQGTANHQALHIYLVGFAACRQSRYMAGSSYGIAGRLCLQLEVLKEGWKSVLGQIWGQISTAGGDLNSMFLLGGNSARAVWLFASETIKPPVIRWDAAA